MRSKALWLWCIVLLVGCEAKQASISSTSIVTKTGEYVELKRDKLTMRVKVLKAAQPTTIALMRDDDEAVSYSSLTVHDCDKKVSTLKHLTIYDDKLNVLSDVDMDTPLDVERGSISEAELELACSKGTDA